MCLHLFTPYHLINYTYVRLDDLNDLCGNGVSVVWYWDAIVAILVHFYCEIDTLEESLSVDARENEAAFVECFGTLGRGTDADGCKRMTYGGEETAFLWKCTRVRNDRKGIHLETVVVMEAKRLLNLYARIELEA